MWNVTRERNRSDITLGLHAKLFRGLADPRRLQILLRLAAGSCSAGDLADECGLSPSNASNHLRCLLDCGLVSLEPQGRRNVYRLTDPRVEQLLDASRVLLASPAGTLIKACCNYESVSRRALRSSSAAKPGGNADDGSEIRQGHVRNSSRATQRGGRITQ